MATSKKNYYYVLVFTDEGPVYVTSVDNATYSARWEKDKDPKALSKSYAEDVVLGLNLNCFQAVLVSSKYELYQPYYYAGYDCKFIEKT